MSNNSCPIENEDADLIRPLSRAKLYDSIVRAAMPLLFVSVGWVANSILSHDERIRTLELQAFTKDDAANMEKDFPPPWFRERFDNLSRLLEKQQEDIATMKTKITIIETKVK